MWGAVELGEGLTVCSAGRERPHLQRGTRETTLCGRNVRNSAGFGDRWRASGRTDYCFACEARRKASSLLPPAKAGHVLVQSTGKQLHLARRGPRDWPTTYTLCGRKVLALLATPFERPTCPNCSLAMAAASAHG
jgi:hypothetical protein